MKAHIPILATLVLLLLTAICGCKQDDTDTDKTTDLGQPPLETVTAEQVEDMLVDDDARLVMLHVWATWCPPCVEEFADVVKVAKEHRDRGLRVILLSADKTDDRPAVLDFLERHEVGWTTYRASNLDHDFITTISTDWEGALPATFFYTPDGELVNWWQGARQYEDHKQAVEQGLKQAPEADTGNGKLGLGERVPATDVAMQSTAGQTLTLDDVAGEKGTVVIFSCNHCPFVQAWEGRMVELANRYSERGVGVVFVNSNDPEKYPTDDLEHMREQAREGGYEVPYVVDARSAVARAFGAERTPECFLFDGGGRLVYRGAVDDNPHQPDQVEDRYLEDALKALVAGEEIPQPKTRSVGCSIKFR